MKRTLQISMWLFLLMVHVHLAKAGAQARPVSARAEIVQSTLATNSTASKKMADASNVVLWLVPLDLAEQTASVVANLQRAPKLVQRNKTFEPHVLIVPIGTKVEFPNKDPFFHNIFSLYDGRRFDLGLYEAGSTRTVVFDRPGVSLLFCNIHAEISAVVVAVSTPYFALSGRNGELIIPNVPDGRYQLNVWYERSTPESLKELTRVVTISDSSRNLGTVRIPENPDFTPSHKNKYGLDYVPPPNTNYDHP